MSAPNTAGWVRLGLLLLPIYGVLTFIGTFTHQPDPNTDFEAYARYLSTTSYLVQHLRLDTRHPRGNRSGNIPGRWPFGTPGALRHGRKRRGERLRPDDLRLLYYHLAGYRAVVPGRPSGRHRSKRSHLQLCGVRHSRRAGAVALHGEHHPLRHRHLALGNAAEVGGSSLCPNGISHLHRRITDWTGANPRNSTAHSRYRLDLLERAASGSIVSDRRRGSTSRALTGDQDNLLRLPRPRNEMDKH
jgi:hypothetical protein